jgi:hypothetical protein
MEKQYLNSVSLKKGNYGIKMSVKVDDLIAELVKLKNEKGYANFEIKERSAPSQYGHTHYIQVDTWEPK